jgi:hypothetical protein
MYLHCRKIPTFGFCFSLTFLFVAMTNHELFEYVRSQVAERAPVAFSDAVLAMLEPAQAQYIADRFGAGVFMRLPEREVKFFTWLREAAPAVWEDLWGSDEIGLEPYIVGIGLLPQITQHGRGYPICDLVSEQNFYFSSKSFNAEEAKPYMDAAVALFEDKKEISLEQAFMLELRRAPIDIWRFAYMYNLPVAAVKNAALKLIQDGLLKAASTRDELSDLMEI